MDRYRYDVAVPPSMGVPRTVVLGDPASPLRFEQPWLGQPPADLATPLAIAERRGCDPDPVDPADPEGQLTLTSFVWPDDRIRLGRLRAALAVAAADPPAVDASGAAGWLADQLGRPRPGAVTVVWHSVVWQYVDSSQRREVLGLLGEAAGRASRAAPLAYVTFEPRQAPPRWSGVFELRMSVWPSGWRRGFASWCSPPSCAGATSGGLACADSGPERRRPFRRTAS